MIYPRVNIEIGKFTGNTVRLSTQLASRLGLSYLLSAFIQFGQKREKVSIETDASQSPKTLLFSEALAQILYLPAGLDLSLKVAMGTLTLGPTIGVLCHSLDFKSDLEDLTQRLHSYAQLRGAVIVFKDTDILPLEGCVKGHIYLPHKGFTVGKWAIPTTLFGGKQALSLAQANRLHPIFGDAIFNVAMPASTHVPYLAVRSSPLPKGCQFSVFLQKNQGKEWMLTSLLATDLAPETSSRAIEAAAYLIREKSYTQADAFAMHAYVSELAVDYAEELCHKGHQIAELQVTLTIGESGHTSISNPANSSQISAEAFKGLHPIKRHELRAKPLFYAKALAGFPNTP